MESANYPDNRLLTRAEVAKIFQVSPSTITRWAKAGKLPAVKTLGGHRRYKAKDVMELARRAEPAAPTRTETNPIQKKLVSHKGVEND